MKYLRKQQKSEMFIIPFLTLLFQKEAEQVPMKPMPLSIKSLPASETHGSVNTISEETSENSTDKDL